MNNLLKITLASVITLAVSSTALSADVAKGQKLYAKKLKKACGISGASMAGKHTQDEWTEINDAGNLKKEIQTICPSAKKVKDKYLPHFYDFFKEYSSDSGNVPSC